MPEEEEIDQEGRDWSDVATSQGGAGSHQVLEGKDRILP